MTDFTAVGNQVDVDLPDGTTQPVMLRPGENEQDVRMRVLALHKTGMLPAPRGPAADPNAGHYPPGYPKADPTAIPSQQAAAGPPQGPTLQTTATPSGWDTIKDIAHNLAASVPSTMQGMSYSMGALAGLPQAAWDYLTRGKPSPELRAYDKVLREGAGEWNAAGAGYQPKTRQGEFARAVGEGVTGSLLTRGEQPALRAVGLGAASGSLSNVAENAFSDQSGQGGIVPGYAAAAAPYLASAGVNFLNPASSIYALARHDIADTHPGAVFPGTNISAADVAASAKANRIPTMEWQHHPPGTPMYERGISVARAPEARDVRAQLANIEYGTPGDPSIPTRASIEPKPGPAAAPAPEPSKILTPQGFWKPEEGVGTTPQLEASNMFPSSVQGDPAHAAVLAEALRRTDALRRSGTPAGPLLQAPAKSMENVALLHHLVGTVSPETAHAASLVGGGLGLKTTSAIQHLMGNPTAGALNELYTAPTMSEFETIAARRPKMDALRQMLQAYLVPGGEGYSPRPGGSQ